MAQRRNLIVYKTEWTKLYNEGLSMRKIADRFKVSKTSVKRILGEVEINPKTKANDEFMRASIVAMYLQGMSFQSMYKKTRVSFMTIKRILIEEEVLDVENEIKKLKFPQYLDIIKNNYQDGLSLSEIGERLGISSSTVMNYLLLSEVPRRTYIEAGSNLDDNYFDEFSFKKAFIYGVLISRLHVYSKYDKQVFNCSCLASPKRLKSFENMFSNFASKLVMISNEEYSHNVYQFTSKVFLNSVTDVKYCSLKDFKISFIRGLLYGNGALLGRNDDVSKISLHTAVSKDIVVQILNDEGINLNDDMIILNKDDIELFKSKFL